MLVLTRKVGDSIVIGHEIIVTVLEVRSDQVRIGIDAPREVSVHREEVYRQMVEQNEAAVASAERAEALRRRLRRPPPRRGQGGKPSGRPQRRPGRQEPPEPPDAPSDPGGDPPES